MNETFYQLMWLFVLYSFFGWLFGTVAAAARTKKFIDVGFLYGPYCPAYGITAVVFTIFLSELKGRIFFPVSWRNDFILYFDIFYGIFAGKDFPS